VTVPTYSYIHHSITHRNKMIAYARQFLSRLSVVMLTPVRFKTHQISTLA